MVPRPLKIVRIIARLNIGGPARHVTLLNAGLQAHGHHTLLIHGSVGPGEADLDTPLIEHRIPTLKTALLGRRLNVLTDFRALVSLVGVMFRESPDVVHTHTAKAGALGRVAAGVYNLTRPRRRRCLVVHTYHGLIFEGYFHPAVSGLIRMAERMLGRITDRIVTISPLQRRDIVDRFKIVPDTKTSVVPLGLDLRALIALGNGTPTLRPQLSAADDDVIVGYVGRMVLIKDLPTLLRAFALASERHPRLRLLLAGDGPTRRDVEALAATLRIEQRTHLLGWIHDLSRLYATMDICAVSSVNEGTPVAIIEAMAAGKPVVATSVGGVPDVVEDGVTGLLAPARGVEILADAIVRLAADRAMRDRMGTLGRERAAARYSDARMVQDIERLYVSALSDKRGSGT